MRKVIFGIVLGMLFLTLAFGLTEYNNPASVAQAPPDEIDVTQALAKENGGAITQEQWAYGDNLEKADLALYPNAQMALGEKHGLSVNVELAEGPVGPITYDKGKLTNKGVTLDLASPGLKGARIVALGDGGFSISKESSTGKFEYSGNEIDFKDSTGNVEVKPTGEIILPNGATLKDGAENTITALQDGLTVKKEESTTIIKGVGKVETPAGVGYVGLGEKDGIIVLEGGTLVQDLTMCNSDRCMREEPSNNYVWAHKKGNYKSGELEMSQSKPVEFDEEMRKTLIELAGGEDMALLKRTEALTADFKPYFSPDVAQKLARGIYGESPSFTEIGGSRGLLAMEKTASGESKLNTYIVGKTGPIKDEFEETESSLTSPSAGTGAIHFSNKGTGIRVPYGGGEITIKNPLSSLIYREVPGFEYQNTFGGVVAASLEYDPTGQSKFDPMGQSMMVKIDLLGGITSR